MRRLAQHLLLVLLSMTSVAAMPAAARAQIIDPPANNSTIPLHIIVVGHDGAGQADPIGQFTVTVRDLANNPVAGANVVCDFSNYTDLEVAATQPFPGVSSLCANHSVLALTDVSGVATFRVVGAATSSGPSGTGMLAMRIYADGVLLGNISAAALDLVGQDGLSGSDLAAWTTDAFSGLPLARSDYDGSGAIGGSDLAIWARAYFANGSRFGAGSLAGGLCP